MPRALAVDIGGTKLAAGIVELPGPVVTHRRTVATPAQEGGGAVLAAVTQLGRAVLQDAADDGLGVDVIGVASAGTVSPADGRITHATDTLPAWAGTPLGEHLASVLDRRTTVLNDVHAHGVGEAVYGEGAGHRSVLVVAVGTGVGGALVVGGEPMVGAHGVAGHAGHLPVPEAAGLRCTCGRVGHLEGLASGAGLRADFLRRTGQDLPAREIAALLTGPDGAGPDRDNDHADSDLVAAAHAVLEASGRATGRTIGSLLNVLDPDIVVVGGGLAQAPHPWRDSLTEGVALEAMDPVADTRVVISSAGPDAALWGAAHVALRRAGSGLL
ncbi:ROK family protein [Ornithinimicrobium cryptoxanthini]|uniref:ROK family protein n=1 Tax=Ornithinimicrobium cryptoxanthini TaxID=2934161 RepID=A0ABY4YJQ0_9MICO|nr:ROK family protein [Ornithinimicrobium cryptoxanthini]USQ76989.1 ROK family protein [Ornithinimicrobium cryptoxanthini]